MRKHKLILKRGTEGGSNSGITTNVVFGTKTRSNRRRCNIPQVNNTSTNIFGTVDKVEQVHGTPNRLLEALYDIKLDNTCATQQQAEEQPEEPPHDDYDVFCHGRGLD